MDKLPKTPQAETGISTPPQYNMNAIRTCLKTKFNLNDIAT